VRAVRALILALALVAYGNAKSWYDLVVLHTTAAGSTFGVGAGVLVALVILATAAVLHVDLGLLGGTWRASVAMGLRLGATIGGTAAALTIIGGLLGIAIGSVTPAARVPWDQLLWRAALLIWVDTAIPEELAFRGALMAALGAPSRATVAWSSLAFAAWHLVVVQQDGATEWWVYAGKLLVIAFGGLLFGWLRVVSGSVLGPIVAHWLFDFLAMTSARLAAAV
jgi:uncharacterized protein